MNKNNNNIQHYSLSRPTHHTELVDIPLFDFERSRPNPYAEPYDEDAELVIHASREERSVILEPGVAEDFPDSESVNAALRAFLAPLSRIKTRSFLLTAGGFYQKVYGKIYFLMNHCQTVQILYRVSVKLVIPS